MRYTVVLLPDAELGGYVAYVPVVGVTTQGDTMEEAFAMAADAASLMLDAMTDDGEELPTEVPGVIIGSVEAVLGTSTLVGAGVAAESVDAVGAAS